MWTGQKHCDLLQENNKKRKEPDRFESFENQRKIDSHLHLPERHLSVISEEGQQASSDNEWVAPHESRHEVNTGDRKLPSKKSRSIESLIGPRKLIL